MQQNEMPGAHQRARCICLTCSAVGPEGLLPSKGSITRQSSNRSSRSSDFRSWPISEVCGGSLRQGWRRSSPRQLLAKMSQKRIASSR